MRGDSKHEPEHLAIVIPDELLVRNVFASVSVCKCLAELRFNRSKMIPCAFENATGDFIDSEIGVINFKV